MIVNLQLINGTFFFVEDISLIRMIDTKIDLSNRSDAVIKCLALGIIFGLITASENVVDIINLISDEDTKRYVIEAYNSKVDPSLSIATSEANVEVIDEEINKENLDVKPAKDNDDIEDTDSNSVEKLLEIKHVSVIIKKLKLIKPTKEFVELLITTEKANKNRPGLIKALEEWVY